MPAVLASVFAWLLIQGVRTGQTFVKVTWRRDRHPLMFWLMILSLGFMVAMMVVMLWIGVADLFGTIPSH